MNSGTRWKAVLLLAFVLAAGIALGWLGHERLGRSHRRGARGTERLVERLAKDLSLSAAQRDSVRVILERRRAGIDSLWAEVHPRFDEARARTHAEVERVLTPEQVEKYRERIAAREESHRERRGEKGR